MPARSWKLIYVLAAAAADETSVRAGATPAEDARVVESSRNLLYEPPYAYVGCYEDRADRALPHSKGWTSTTADCSRLCASIGSTHMGRQWWGECYCGGSPRYGIYGESAACQNCQDAGTNVFFGGANCVFELTTLPAIFVGLPAPVTSYVGCYEDEGSNRDLPHYAGQLDLPGCAAACSNLGYSFMGRQWQQECWCGDDYDSYSPSVQCNDCTNSVSGYNIGGAVNCVFSLRTRATPTPTEGPTAAPSTTPITGAPSSSAPTEAPVTSSPTAGPSGVPSNLPTTAPSTAEPSTAPSGDPTKAPITSDPTGAPTFAPSGTPTGTPKTADPTNAPSESPTRGPSSQPTAAPRTLSPSDVPSLAPTNSPATDRPTDSPATLSPTDDPSDSPTDDAPTTNSSCGGPNAAPFQCPVIAFEGCYLDSAVRDLPVYAGGGMTTQMCAATCSFRGYGYVGRQWTGECWCGQSYGLHGASTGCNNCLSTDDAAHNFGGSVNCVFAVKVAEPDPACVVSPVKALLIKPDTFVWWHGGGWGTNVAGYVRWLQDRIVALKNLGLVQGVAVAVRMNDEIAGTPYSDFFYESDLPHTALYAREGYDENLLYEFLRAVRLAGVETYAWIPALFDPYLIQSADADASLAAMERGGSGPQGGLTSSDRFASVFRNEARERVYDIINEVLTKPELNEVKEWDGVRLDYIRYESYQYDFSDDARAQFKAEYAGGPDPYNLAQDPTDPDWYDWMMFRRDAVTNFLRNATAVARSASPLGAELDVGGYLLPFAAPGCMEDHYHLNNEKTYGWEQGNCYEDYAPFDFRLLPMTYWQDWAKESNFDAWTTTVVNSTVGHATGYGNHSRATPCGSLTYCDFESPQCSSTRTDAEVVASFRAFAEIAAREGTDGIDVFLFDEFEDSHLNNLEDALVLCP